jgi:hypothetical protein
VYEKAIILFSQLLDAAYHGRGGGIVKTYTDGMHKQDM